jgi:hypothetical protein
MPRSRKFGSIYIHSPICLYGVEPSQAHGHIYLTYNDTECWDLELLQRGGINKDNFTLPVTRQSAETLNGGSVVG